MSTDTRPNFHDGLAQLKKFLIKENWPTDLIWLTEGHLRSHQRNIWIYRPHELLDESIGEEFYSEILTSDSSIKFLGLGQLAGKSVVCVEKYVGDPGHFYMSLLTSRMNLHTVQSPLHWAWICLLSIFREPSLLVKDIQTPRNATSKSIDDSPEKTNQ